jgi:hypothetical protein
VERIIEELKDRGLPITFCKKRHAYHYEKEVFVKFEVTVIDGDEKKKIIGGENKNFDFFKDFWVFDSFSGAPR